MLGCWWSALSLSSTDLPRDSGDNGLPTLAEQYVREQQGPKDGVRAISNSATKYRTYIGLSGAVALVFCILALANS
jgi:hypothetical protein